MLQYGCHAILQGFVDPINNFAQYRQALEASISQADQAQKRGWVVPFFSLIVKDIYFMHEGMTNRYVQSYTVVYWDILGCTAIYCSILGYTGMYYSMVRYSVIY